MCMYNYHQTGSLTVNVVYFQGDFITVVSKPYSDWWMGKVTNSKPGLFCTLLVDTRPLGKLFTTM